MKNKFVKIGYSEIWALAVIFIGTKVFLGYPRLVVEWSGTAGWMLILISGGLSVLLWYFVATILERFPGKSLTNINQMVLGPWIGLFINIIFIVYITISTSFLLRLFSEAVILTALPEAPISSLTFLFLIPVLVAAYLGLESVTRSAYIALPYITFGVLAVLLSLIPEINPSNILPLFGNGFQPLLRYGAINISAFGEIIFLLYLIPYFSFSAKTLKRVGIATLIFVIAGMLLIVLIYLFSFPYPEAIEKATPFYQLTQKTYLGRYFQRIEAVFVLFWTFSAFLRIAAGIITTALITQQTFKLPYFQPLLPAFGLLFFSIALTPVGALQTVALINLVVHTYGALFTFGIPLAVLTLAQLRKGKDYEQID